MKHLFFNRRWKRLAMVGLIGSIGVGLGAQAFAHGGMGWGGMGWGGMGRHGMHGDADPQTMQRRAEAMAKWMLADVNATPEQEKRIAEIFTATRKELAPLRDKHREARQEAMKLLAQPTIDRNALEALRAQQVQLADQLSRRMAQSMADAAEVLTPEQRTKLAERMQKRHDERGRHRSDNRGHDRGPGRS